MTKTGYNLNIWFQNTLEHRKWYPYWPFSWT